MGSYELHCNSPGCIGYVRGVLRHNGTLAYNDMTPLQRLEVAHDLEAMRVVRPASDGSQRSTRSVADVLKERAQIEVATTSRGMGRMLRRADRSLVPPGWE